MRRLSCSRHGLIWLAVLCLVLCGCKKDEDTDVANMVTEFCDVDIKGNILQTFALDDGRTYSVASQQITVEAEKDSTYRGVITYSVENGIAKVHGLSSAICTQPLPSENFKTKPHDPLKLVSIWKGGKYINMQLTKMTTDKGSHKYGFCIDSVRSKVLYISLLHQKPKEDAESYSERIYASMPLNIKCMNEKTYDSICLTIVTYEGAKSYKF